MRKLSHNALFNIAGGVIPLAVTLVTVPLYLRLIGDVRFGVLAIVWLLLSYFALFDMGLGRATSKFMAGLHDCSGPERESLFWTALAVNTIFGLAGGFVLWGLGKVFLLRFFTIPASMQQEVFAALPWVAAAVPVATGVSVLTGALEGREQFFSVNALQIFGGAIFQVVPLAVAWWRGPDLRLLIASAVTARLAAAIPMMLACRKRVPLNAKPSVETRWVRDLFSFGGWITVSGVLQPILTSLDRLLVGSLMGAAALTYYSVSFSFASKFGIIPSSIGRALFPRLAMQKGEEAGLLSERVALGLAVALTPMVILAIVLVHPFFVLWLGTRLAALSAPTAEIFLAAFWINSLAGIPSTLLHAQGRPDLTAKFHVLEVLPFMGVLWAGLYYGGVEGAAWAWALRVAANALLLFAGASLLKKVLTLLLPCALLILLTCLAVQHVGDHIFSRLLLGVVSLGVYALWAWIAARSALGSMWDQGLGLLISVKSALQGARP